jgi:hypothetical protein
MYLRCISALNDFNVQGYRHPAGRQPTAQLRVPSGPLEMRGGGLAAGLTL